MSDSADTPEPRYVAYRCNVNLMGLQSGDLIEIDPDDPAWWGPIEAGFVVEVAHTLSLGVFAPGALGETLDDDPVSDFVDPEVWADEDD